MDGRAADLVVGVEEGFGEQGAHVAAAESVHDALALTLSFDQTGEAQFDRCWLATVGRQSAIAARLATSSSASRSAHSMRTRVGSASSANEVTAALT